MEGHLSSSAGGLAVVKVEVKFKLVKVKGEVVDDNN